MWINISLEFMLMQHLHVAQPGESMRCHEVVARWLCFATCTFSGYNLGVRHYLVIIYTRHSDQGRM